MRSSRPPLLNLGPVAQNNLGGAGRDRTDDLKLAKLPLSQLSYSPVLAIMVGLGRFELPTSPLSGVRSNQLSYRPDIIRTLLVGRRLIQPTGPLTMQSQILSTRSATAFQNWEGMPGRRARRARPIVALL